MAGQESLDGPVTCPNCGAGEASYKKSSALWKAFNEVEEGVSARRSWRLGFGLQGPFLAAWRSRGSRLVKRRPMMADDVAPPETPSRRWLPVWVEQRAAEVLLLLLGVTVWYVTRSLPIDGVLGDTVRRFALWPGVAAAWFASGPLLKKLRWRRFAEEYREERHRKLQCLYDLVWYCSRCEHRDFREGRRLLTLDEVRARL